jgi:acyl carrier protein
MSIKSTVISEIRQIAEEHHNNVPPLTDDLVLLDSGLDSLGIAILVTRLEETLGFDPFTESDESYYPVTLGDFIRFYENGAKSRVVDAGRTG